MNYTLLCSLGIALVMGLCLVVILFAITLSGQKSRQEEKNLNELYGEGITTGYVIKGK